MLSDTLTNPRDFILDSGPLYHEFHFDSWIKEPWNAYSSLFFLIPVLFWLWKLRGQYRKYSMITILLPLLFLNALGSTIYHAFRASDLALMLDWMPAMVMNLILCWYFWNKLIKKPLISGVIVLTFFMLSGFIMSYFGATLGDRAINLSYLLIGIGFIIPMMTFLINTRFYKWHLLAMTFLFLGIALLFRILDYPTPNPFPELLPQGTHFLWHIVSALAVFSLGFYFKAIRDKNL